MRVLLGTTNPSKVKRFSDLLKGYDIEFITLRDIEVIEEPKERIILYAFFNTSINKIFAVFFID